MGLGENQDLLPDPLLDGQIKLQNRLIDYMAFFSSAVSTLSTLVTAIGAGLGVWGVVNLLEGYGNDNPGAKSQGIKHLMSSM